MSAGDYSFLVEPIINQSLAYVDAGGKDISQLLQLLFDLDEMPMHAPIHHFILPAALLAIAMKEQGADEAAIRKAIHLADKRTSVIPGGFCGYQGACGAGIGLGVFWSIITGSDPLTTKDSWKQANRATGQALVDISFYGGPRCCKRVSFTAAKSALSQIEQVLEVTIEFSEPVCKYHDNNRECLKEKCPYYEEQAI